MAIFLVELTDPLILREWSKCLRHCSSESGIRAEDAGRARRIRSDVLLKQGAQRQVARRDLVVCVKSGDGVRCRRSGVSDIDQQALSHLALDSDIPLIDVARRAV